MTGELTADNLETGLTQDGRLTIEPGYLGYLRTQGYQIDQLKELHAVDSDSSEKAHIVAKVGTFEYPKDHPALDYAEHSIDLWACDCWSFRTEHSVDLTESSPAGCSACKHIETVSKAEKAKQDESQETLV